MANWFRFYDDAVNDPKIIELPDDLFRAWVNILCVAAKNDGVLPEMKHVALVLRVKPTKAAALVTRLVAAGLIDNHAGVFAPHNWQGRQFKSDDSGARVKKHREKLRNEKSNGECNVTCNDECNALEEKRGDEKRIDDDGRTRAGTSLISAEAFEIADTLEKSCGYDLPEEIPPGWCGGAMWVQKCLNEGWIGAVMIDAAKGVARRAKTPIMGFKYLEKPLAQAMAEHRAPLPQVEIRQPEKLTVTANGKQSGNVIQAADRLLDKIRSFDAGPGEVDRIRDTTGQASARLLS
jgi:hypothetical protein